MGGMSPKTVSKQVGHQNVTTTLNIYNKYVSSDDEVVRQLNNMYDFMDLEFSTVSTVSQA